MKQFSLLFTLILTATASNAQLIINELSQGPAGSQEFVELLVTGTPTCGGSNTVDLRGWVIDDNNSWHATGAGTGIAAGHVRFDSIPQWANVKIGSLIVIYNDADTSSSIHALTVDTNDANNDYVYVIPVSSSVLQKNTNLPASNGTMTTYAVGGTTYSPTGTWSGLGMANSGDAFHTVSPANYSVAYFAIGWGNVNTALNVYYSLAQNAKDIYMTNAVDNNPFNSANFVDTTAATETPGAPNNPANAAWIHSLNNNGQPFVTPTVSFNNPAPLTCSNTSTVIIASSTTTGAIFNWSNGVIGANDTITTGGKYYVTVSDAANTCSTVDSITITSSSTLSISTSSISTSCGNSNGTATVTVTSGTATGYIWSNSGNTASISNLPSGTYTVTVNATGGCSATASVTVNSSIGTTVTITSNKLVFCADDSAQICAPNGFNAYVWSTGATSACIYVKQAGNYYVTVTDNSNCTAESNHIAIAVHPQPPVSISVNGDTLNAYGASSYQWYFNNNLINGANTSMYITPQSGNYSVLVTDTNGCTALSNATPVTVTGINDLTIENGLSVYPNPLTSGRWNLEIENNLLGASLEIFDNTGRLIYQSEIRNQKSEIRLDFAKGVYLLKISSGKNIFTKKLIRL